MKLTQDKLKFLLADMRRIQGWLESIAKESLLDELPIKNQWQFWMSATRLYQMLGAFIRVKAPRDMQKDVQMPATLALQENDEKGSFLYDLHHQVNAGTGRYGSIWHLNNKGEYWSGDWSHRTPQELFDECTSTLRDLLLNHPDIVR